MTDDLAEWIGKVDIFVAHKHEAGGTGLCYQTYDRKRCEFKKGGCPSLV